ncbi:hypothetical protein Hdeb2414_s0002g00062371 [Helianthus debilis subsp. tardiflorus]
MYMINKVLENLIGKSIEQQFEEIELEEVRARRKAEIEAEMKNKGKSIRVEGVSEVTERAIVLSSMIMKKMMMRKMKKKLRKMMQMMCFLQVVMMMMMMGMMTMIKVRQNVEGEGEHNDSENVDDSEKLILHLEPDIEEGEIRHTYTLDEIIKMTHGDENNFKFDFEEELNQFDINQQPDYQYKYVEEADNYDRVKVEDWSDEDQSESAHVDTSNFPTLAEFFSQANDDELRRKVEECEKNKSFDEMTKDERCEERKKWFRKSSEWKFKRP